MLLWIGYGLLGVALLGAPLLLRLQRARWDEAFDLRRAGRDCARESD